MDAINVSPEITMAEIAIEGQNYVGIRQRWLPLAEPPRIRCPKAAPGACPRRSPARIRLWSSPDRPPVRRVPAACLRARRHPESPGRDAPQRLEGAPPSP